MENKKKANTSGGIIKQTDESPEIEEFEEDLQVNTGDVPNIDEDIEGGEETKLGKIYSN